METEKIKLSELLAMDMGQLSDWMVSKKGSYDTVTLSPQAGQAEASSLSDLLCALKKYTAKNGRPYLRVAFFDDGSCEILDGDDIIENFDDTDELMEMIGT